MSIKKGVNNRYKRKKNKKIIRPLLAKTKKVKSLRCVMMCHGGGGDIFDIEDDPWL